MLTFQEINSLAAELCQPPFDPAVDGVIRLRHGTQADVVLNLHFMLDSPSAQMLTEAAFKSFIPAWRQNYVKALELQEDMANVYLTLDLVQASPIEGYAFQPGEQQQSAKHFALAKHCQSRTPFIA